MRVTRLVPEDINLLRYPREAPKPSYIIGRLNEYIVEQQGVLFKLAKQLSDQVIHLEDLDKRRALYINRKAVHCKNCLGYGWKREPSTGDKMSCWECDESGIERGDADDH